MPFTNIFPNVYQLSSGPVNIWLIEDEAGLTLIDTNYPGREEPILAAVRAIGKNPADLHNILLTHCHPDHAGSLAALKQRTGARAWMHPADAEAVRGRGSMGEAHVSPGLLNAVLYRLFINGGLTAVDAAEIEHEIQDGEILPCGGGIQAVHTPGHSLGHTAYFLARSSDKDGGILFLGDACSNMAGLDYSIVYADRQEGRRSLAKLARLDIQAVCFSHGRMLKGKGVEKFKHKWM